MGWWWRGQQRQRGGRHRLTELSVRRRLAEAGLWLPWRAGHWRALCHHRPQQVLKRATQRWVKEVVKVLRTYTAETGSKWGNASWNKQWNVYGITAGSRFLWIREHNVNKICKEKLYPFHLQQVLKQRAPSSEASCEKHCEIIDGSRLWYGKQCRVK